MTVTAYSQLKQQVILAVQYCGSQTSLLESLKNLFIEEINSPRRFEKIKTLGELIHVLEIRDALSAENVKPLKKIAGRLPNSLDLLRSLKEYENSIVQMDVEHLNHYVPRKSQPANMQPSEQLNHFSNNPYGMMSNVKKQRLLDKVIDEIGNSWRDLARNLGVRERKINEIDFKNTKLHEKARDLLEFYLSEKAERDKWFFAVCDALDKSRRKDLVRDLEKILLMNI